MSIELILGSGIVALAMAIITLIFKVSRWSGRIDEKFVSVDAFMREIREDVKNIFNRLPPSTVSGNSPRQLTDLGKKVSEEVRAEDWAGSIVNTVFPDIAGR